MALHGRGQYFWGCRHCCSRGLRAVATRLVLLWPSLGCLCWGIMSGWKLESWLTQCRCCWFGGRSWPWQPGLRSGRAWVVFVGEQRPDGGSSLDGLGQLQTIKVACVWLAGGNRWDFGGPSLRTCSQAEPGPSSGNKKESNLWREEVRSQHCQPPHCNWLLPG